MSGWDWLNHPQRPATWGFIARVLIKAALLFIALNIVFAVINPLPALERLSLYGVIFTPRDRLPYGDDPARDYAVTLDSLPAMIASHAISQPKAPDEFRVIVLGDSGTWGWFLSPDETYTAHLNAKHLTTDDGRRVVTYNLAYPVISAMKDLLILDAVRHYQPDLIIWLITLDALPHEKQLFPPLVQANADRTRQLIADYDLALSANDARLTTETDFFSQTLIGQRRQLADWIRLQGYGIAWTATGHDQYIPPEIPLRQSDFDEDLSWSTFAAPTTLTPDDLSLDVIAAAYALVDVPLVLVNEPIYVSDGRNSDLRYNSFYPRWAYDQYRDLLATVSADAGWQWVDLWDRIPPLEFTDSPVHLSGQGSVLFADLLGAVIADHD